jgi:hypothetical protein
MTIIKNHFEVFLVTSKKQGNGIIESKVGLYSIKASHTYLSVKCQLWLRFRVRNSTVCPITCVKWVNDFKTKLYLYIQGLSELADQNNTVKSSSSGNNRKNIFLKSILIGF